MRKLFLLPLFAIALILFLLILRNSIEVRLLLWGADINLQGFKMTGFTGSTLEAEKEGVLAKMTKSEVENNQKLVEDRVYLLNSLFVPTTSPYPEVLSSNITCPEEFKPKEIDRRKGGRVYALFAGERFGFGVCSQDLVKYRAVYGIFDCRKKGVFEIRIYGQQEEELKNIIKSFNCKND